MTFDFKPYTRKEFLEVSQEAITGQLGKVPDLARCVAERAVLRMKDVRQALRVVKRLVAAVLEEKKRQTIVMLVTHDAALADALSDERLRLESGRVMETPA